MDYDEKVEKNTKRNEKYLKEFEKWLNDKDLSKKTIRKHINNADLYINYYLTYYDITLAEDGVNHTYSFFDGWFIEKCLWSSKNAIKETASSIKKFYQYMSDKGYVTEDDYKDMIITIKDNMDIFLQDMDAYENGTYYDMFL